MSSKLRLKQFLVRAGAAPTQKAAIALIHRKEVTVDKMVVTNTDYQIDPEKRAVSVRGHPMRMHKEKIYLLYNKPRGIVCQKNEPHNVYDEIKKIETLSRSEKDSLFCIGRLDRDTSGLLLVTNDGRLARTVLSTSVFKTYRVLAAGKIPDERIETLRRGAKIQVEDETKMYMTRSALVTDVATTKDGNTSLRITIDEGKKRQVRLMLEAVGNKVLELERVAIGELSLDDIDIAQGAFKSIERGKLVRLLGLA